MALALRIRTGDLAGRLVCVENELVVGRAPTCDLTVADQRLSRRHARFFVEDGALCVEDLGSPNGTIVNQTRVPRARLDLGDQILLGKTEMVVVSNDDESPTVPPVQVVPRVASVEITPRLIKFVEDSNLPGMRSMGATEFLAAIGLPADETQLEPRRDVFNSVLTRARHFAILHGIGEVIQREQDPQEMLARVLDLTLEVTGADRGYVALIREGEDPTIAIARGKLPDDRQLTVSQTVMEHVVERRCGVICIDPSADARFQDAASLMLNQTRALMAVPIVVQNRVLGLVQVESGHLSEKFSEPDLDLLSTIAATTGVALDNLELARAREQTIRELEEANSRLVSAQERLVRSEQLAAIGRFATGIAHEVKNHLSPFALANEIARKYPNDERTREAAEMMQEAQQHILDLVNEIRNFARGESSIQERSTYDLAEVVEGVIKFIACDRAASRANLEARIEDRPIVELDPRSFRQVLLNLIKNAIDALPEKNGSVVVRVREQEGFALVDVADNGCGIPAELAQRVFEPFFTTKGDRGLGLGLDISKQIVEAHGGHLTFASAAGQGTTFRVTVPLLGTTIVPD